MNSTLLTERFIAFAISSVSNVPARADHHAGDHQRRVLQHEAFKADRKAGEGIVDRDHHRHIGAADRQRHQDAEEQRAAEEQIDQLRYRDQRCRAALRDKNDVAADRERRQHDNAVEACCPVTRNGLLMTPVELGPGDQRTGQRHGADQRADQRHDKLGCALRLVAEQLDRGDGAGSTAAHAVVERDHLRHGRHRHLLAAPPGDAAADDERNDGEGDIDDQMRLGSRADIEHVKKARQDGDQHADAGDEDPGRRRDRRRHAFEAVHKQEGGREIGGADRQLCDRREHGVPQPSFRSPTLAWPDFASPVSCPLAWNIASMRSVTA